MTNKTSFAVFTIILLTILSLFTLISCNQKSKSQLKTGNIIDTTTVSNNQYNLIIFQTQWLHQAQFAGFYVAHKKGFYHSNGIDVRIEMGGPENPSPEAIRKGKADFASMFLTSALREIDNGQNIVNIAQISQKSSLLLVAKKSSGIHNINDINGKRVGLWVNDFREPSVTFLHKYNIKAEIVPISWTVNVLTNDVVDIMNMMVYNEYDVLINTGINPEELTVFPLSEYEVNIPEDGIYCQKEFYLKNKDLCKDFAEATLDGWIYALNHEEETLSIVLHYLGQAHLPANIPHQRWMLKKIREAVLSKPEQFGKLTEKDYNSAVSMLKGNRVIKNSIQYRDFIGYADSK